MVICSVQMTIFFFVQKIAAIFLTCGFKGKLTMKKIVLFLMCSGLLLFARTSGANSLTEQLVQLGFEKIRPIDLSHEHYAEAYEMFILQPIDHLHPDKGSFNQRIFIRHKGFDKPTVFVTEGYDASYAGNGHYDEELAINLDANLVVVEHRFFGQSKPDKEDWRQLNLKNATADLHKINQLLKAVYPKPWISTGISKGGQTTIYYRYFYPNDVIASVPYVAPLNFGVADKRVYHFLDTVGCADCRQKLFNIQSVLLRNRDYFEPMFKDSATARNLSFERVGGIEKAFELNVLELGFAFWQWYPVTCDSLVKIQDTTTSYFKVFVQSAGYDFFSDQGIMDMEPFFFQALTEMGFYSYQLKPFKSLLSFNHKPDFRFALPKNAKTRYKHKLNKRVNRWIRKDGHNILYVYGGFDAWSSTAVMPGSETESLKLIKPEGSHATRIRHFDAETRQQAYQLLKKWIQKN